MTKVFYFILDNSWYSYFLFIYHLLVGTTCIEITTILPRIYNLGVKNNGYLIKSKVSIGNKPKF